MSSSHAAPINKDLNLYLMIFHFYSLIKQQLFSKTNFQNKLLPDKYEKFDFS